MGGAVDRLRRRRWLMGAPRAFREAWPVVDAVPGWLELREAELLWTLAAAVPRGEAIVEIGSYLGRSTVALALGAPRGVLVHSVDPHTGDRSEVDAGLTIDTWVGFRENLDRAGCADRVVVFRASSVEAAATWDGPSIGLLFVDGWHSTEAVVADVESWRPHLAAQPILVFDDHNDPEVAAGVSLVETNLPRRLGATGKDLVFGPTALLDVTPRLRALLR